MAVEECYWWLTQSKCMTLRQLQGCCCSVSWFQSWVHASYVWSWEVFLDAQISKWQKCLFSQKLESISFALAQEAAQSAFHWPPNWQVSDKHPLEKALLFLLVVGGCRVSVVPVVSLGSLEISYCFSRMHSRKLSKKHSGLWLLRAFRYWFMLWPIS